MKAITVFIFSLFVTSATALAQPQTLGPDDTARCEKQLSLLEKIANEQCRMMQSHLEGGTGDTLDFLHSRSGCLTSSGNVVRKADECLAML